MGRIKHDLEEDLRDHFRKVEKIKKGQRSVRGRTTDDWIVSATSDLSQEAHCAQLASEGMRFGRVIEAQKKNIFIAEEDAHGTPQTEKLWLCTVAKRHFQRAHKERNFVVVGDRILFVPDTETQFDSEGEVEESDLPRGTIQHMLPRKNKISRKDPMRPEWEHIMLTNIDMIVVVASVLNPEVRWGLIDRFLVQAELEHVPATIVLNKIDLLSTSAQATPEFLATYQKRIEIYRSIGYEVIEVCALKPRKTADAIKHLRALLKGKVVGFTGHSGVGKSSLVNLFKPEFEQIVDDDPEIFYKGRHTTTYNSLLHLGIGAYAIDTPGVRSFRIEYSDPILLSACFKEFRPYKCKFSECAHDLEIDCGIKKAIQDGKISQERHRSYLGILKGTTYREGEGDSSQALLIADLKARAQAKEQNDE